MADAVGELLVQLLSDRLTAVVGQRGPGHCIRVDDIPEAVARPTCERLASTLVAPDIAVLVSQSGSAPIDHTPTQVVELRNRSDAGDSVGVLVVFVPPKERLSVEDSIGSSTFERMSVDDLGDDAWTEVIGRLEAEFPLVADDVCRIGGVLSNDRDRYGVDGIDLAGFGLEALHLALSGSVLPESAAGAALPAVGLLPDRGACGVDDDEARRRLEVNIQQMDTLTEPVAPADRVRQLPLDIAADAELIGVLLETIEDATSDRRGIARALAIRDDVVDLTKWNDVGQGVMYPERLEIVKSLGLAEANGEWYVTEQNASLGVRFECEPPAKQFPDAKLRLEFVNIGVDGEGEPVKRVEKSALPAQSAGTFRKRVSCGDNDSDLRPGIYRMRLSLVGHDGATLKQAESEYFRVGEIEAEPPDRESVRTSFQAVVSAIVRTKRLPGRQTFEVAGDHHHVDQIHVQFEDAGGGRWPIEVSRRLLEFEADFLRQPRTVRGRTIDLGLPDPETEILSFYEIQEGAFLDARAELFAELSAAATASQDVAVPASLLVIDLANHRPSIERYVAAWRDGLASAKAATARELLEIDRVEVRYHRAPAHVLLAPTHPIRLSWRLVHDEAARRWVTGAPDLAPVDLLAEAQELNGALGEVTGDELPLVTTIGDSAFRFRNSLPGGWSYFSTEREQPSAEDSAQLFEWLDVASPRMGRAGATELVSRAVAYLRCHPYVRTFVVNVVNGGSGDEILRMLGALATDFEELRFVVRFFGARPDGEVGRTFDRFMADPDASRLPRIAADRMSRSGPDPLRPRLAFSKHSYDELSDRPQLFPANLTLFLDHFATTIKTVAPDGRGRSIYGHGLVGGSQTRFRPAQYETPPRWTTMVVPVGDGLVQDALRAHDRYTATELGASATAAVPALRLDLDVRTQALLDAVHDASDWVVILDPVFSDQYLDGGRGDGAEVDATPTRYVVDTRDTRSAGELRNVVVSSKLRSEQDAILASAAREFGFEVDSTLRLALLRGLHVLGAGLGLRLLADDTRRTEAFSLALASTFLHQQGFLRHALVIPLDEYSDLFVESRDLHEINSLSRTDLLVVQFDPPERRIAAHLIEVKARRSLGENGGLPGSLADEVVAQLENSRAIVLNRLFGAHLRQRPDSLPAALRTRRLVRVLRRHLFRSVRHGFLPDTEVDDIEAFLDSIDRGLTLSLELRGLIFDLSGVGIQPYNVSGVDFDVIGADHVRELFEAENLATALPSDGEYLATVFGARAELVSVVDAEEEPPADEDTAEIETLTHDSSVDALSIEDVDLVGQATASSQFSVIGVNHNTGRPVALDVGGTNVVSVFGVQGSGKSYSAGAVIEAGLLSRPELGPLPSKLASIVFHYSSDTAYGSEFAAMSLAGGTPVDTPWTGSVTAAGGVDDVLILVPDRQLEERRSEYPSMAVEMLAIGPRELTTSDWKLLMGIDGGKQMYAKALNQVLKGLGSDFGIDDVEQGIADSALSTSQKSIANQRLEFVRDYLRDGARISDCVVPGRLVIVDIRDEYIDKDEALALFMVLLNRLAEARRGGDEQVNKMIVFDEAHKYLDSTSLTDAITEAVREMRHKGVTIVIASQDPPSIPSVVLELSSVIIAHRMTAPTWLKHLQKHNAAFAGVQSGEMAQLRPGQSLVWSSGGSSRYRQPQRVQTRQRLTQHGGDTVRADD